MLLASGSTVGTGTGIAVASIAAPKIATLAVAAPAQPASVVRVESGSSNFSSQYSYVINDVYNSTLKKYERKWQICVGSCKTTGAVTIGSTNDAELNAFRADIMGMKSKEVGIITTTSSSALSGIAALLVSAGVTMGITAIIAGLLALGLAFTAVGMASDWYQLRMDASYHYGRIN